MAPASTLAAPTSVIQERTFEAPGPGSWELDQTHFTRPLTIFAQETIAEPFGRGFADSTARYGLLLERIQVAPVHGLGYMQPRPVGAPRW